MEQTKPIRQHMVSIISGNNTNLLPRLVYSEIPSHVVLKSYIPQV